MTDKPRATFKPTASKTSGASKRKTTVRKATARKTTIRKTTAPKATVRKTAARRTTVRKTAARRTTVRKTAARRTTVRKRPARQTAVRKSLSRNVVVRKIDRASARLSRKLAATGSSTVHEVLGRTGYLGHEIKPIQEGARIGGPAVTVLAHPGDNLMLHAAVEMCKPGDVLVVTTTAPSTTALFGDLLATSLMAQGVVGLVMDAGVRDIADLRSMGFPVWTRHISCQGPVKDTAGSVNIPIAIGGQIINPGDAIIADDDGVVVVPRTDVSEALKLATARVAREGAVRKRLEAGELGVEFYGHRERLENYGVEYLDSAEDL